MKRNVRKDIRWTQHELDTIDQARGDSEFSDFVREAAMESAISIISL